MKRLIIFLSLLVKTFINYVRNYTINEYRKDKVNFFMMSFCIWFVVTTVVFILTNCYSRHDYARTTICLCISIMPFIMIVLAVIGFIIFGILKIIADFISEAITKVGTVSNDYWQQAGEKTELKDKEILLRGSEDNGDQLLRMVKGDK